MQVPTLNLGTQEDGSASKAVSNEEKASGFIATFFPEPELEEQTSTDDEYLTQKFIFSAISNIQIKCVITQLSPYKAPSPDCIPNAVYIQCAEILILHLGPIYQATFSIGIYPSQWKKSTTVVIRNLASQTT